MQGLLGSQKTRAFIPHSFNFPSQCLKMSFFYLNEGLSAAVTPAPENLYNHSLIPRLEIPRRIVLSDQRFISKFRFCFAASLATMRLRSATRLCPCAMEKASRIFEPTSSTKGCDMVEACLGGLTFIKCVLCSTLTSEDLPWSSGQDTCLSKRQRAVRRWPGFDSPRERFF